MAGQFSPCTYRVVADNFIVQLHMRAFIETASDDPTVMLTLNDVSEVFKVDFVTAAGGTRRDNGQKGIFVYLRWTEPPKMGETVTFTCWQKGVKKYSEPVSLPEAGFDPRNPAGGFEVGEIG
jgi:hypothetical protein